MTKENQGVPASPSGHQPSASAPSADAPVSSQSGVPNADEILSALAWCRQQADEIMSVTAGCATTHGDPGGGLEWANRLASDIAINLDMLASGIEARSDETRSGSAEGESPAPEGGDAQ